MSATLSDLREQTRAEERRKHLLVAQAWRLEAMAHDLRAAAYDSEGRYDSFFRKAAENQREFAAYAREQMKWNQECAANYAAPTVSTDEE